MRRNLAACVLAVFCGGCLIGLGGEPICRTQCGLVLTQESGTCEQFQAVETRTLAAFARNVSNFDADYGCRVLKNWRVYQHPPDVEGGHSWWDPYFKSNVAGLADCNVKTIQVAVPLSPGAWEETALSHEIGHALEDCADLTHATWADRGVYAAIDEARVLQ